MAINCRNYKSYKTYLKHQSQKFNIGLKKKVKKFMPKYFSKQVKAFENRVGKFKKYVRGGKVLCLGARTGAEVVAFRNLGFKDFKDYRNFKMRNLRDFRDKNNLCVRCGKKRDSKFKSCINCRK